MDRSTQTDDPDQTPLLTILADEESSTSEDDIKSTSGSSGYQPVSSSSESSDECSGEERNVTPGDEDADQNCVCNYYCPDHGPYYCSLHSSGVTFEMTSNNPMGHSDSSRKGWCAIL